MLGRERFSDIVGQVDRAARPSKAARRQAQGQHVGYRNIVKATPGLCTPAAGPDDANELADEIEASFQARAHRGHSRSAIDTLTPNSSNERSAARVPRAVVHVSVIGNSGVAAKTKSSPPARSAPRPTDPTIDAVRRRAAWGPVKFGSSPRRRWAPPSNENLT
jgi:hypothetical protein